MSAYYMNNIPL